MELKQQTAEWLEMRRSKIGASDAPIIMEASPWKTPYKLWEEKLGIGTDYTSARMQRGLALEEQARNRFIEMSGITVAPKVMVHTDRSWMMASLDGIDSTGNCIVEIKCPNADDHATAISNAVPEKYFPQLQHQMEVAQVDKAYYFSFDGENGVIVELERDDKYIKKMITKELQFWECVQDLIAPKLTARDYVQKSDEEWIVTVSQLLQVKSQIESLEEREEAFRAHLIRMANGQSCEGAGIRFSRLVSKGRVDYTAIPELKAINLDRYRKAPTESWRLERI